MKFLVYGKNVVRVVYDCHGEPLLVASDLCQILKIVTTSKLSKRISKEHYTHTYIQHPQSKNKFLSVAAITLKGFEELIFSVTKKNTKFKEWGFGVLSQLQVTKPRAPRADEIVNYLK